MISFKKLEDQLKRINFHYSGWGRSEVRELCNILMPDEEIEECVNGYYEAGFALLVATKNRLLLVDKKPLNYLTVEDMRFDMINEFDYHHRMVGAQIRISAGAKTMHFTSLNQVRLRRLLNYVQTRMTQIKKDYESHQNAQKEHLEQMNEQLRLYLKTMQEQMKLNQQHPVIYQSPEQLPQPQPASIPTPAVSQPTGPITTPDAFEQAAANALGVTPEEMSVSEAPAPTPQSRPQQIMSAVPRYSQQALQHVENIVLTPQQLSLSAARRVLPVISAYTRLPLMSDRRGRNTSHTMQAPSA